MNILMLLVRTCLQASLLIIGHKVDFFMLQIQQKSFKYVSFVENKEFLKV